MTMHVNKEQVNDAAKLMIHRLIARELGRDPTLGSQSILLSWPDAPVILRTSGEIDAYPENAKIWETPRRSRNLTHVCSQALTLVVVLHHVPVVVCLAVLLSLGPSQKHDAANLSAPRRAWESGRSSLQPFLAETEDLARCKSIT
jgi:hypothetical protein